MQIDLAAHPQDATALIQGGRTVSYGELGSLVGETAAGLLAAGVTAGDRVVIVGPNDVAFVTGLLAARTIGAVACPIGDLNPRAVIEARVSEFSPSAVVVSPLTPEFGDWVVESNLVDQARVGTPSGSPSAELPSFAGVATGAVPVDGSDAAVILHTSGIIGSPRAAVLSGDGVTNAQQRILASGSNLTSADICLGSLPFAHVLGLNMVLLPSLLVGASVALQPTWRADETLELIARHEVSHVIAVPPMWTAWNALAKSDPSIGRLMASVGFARTGASALPAGVAEGAAEGFGIDLGQGYGLTETAGTVTFEPEARRRPGSIGRPLPGVEVKLVEDGTEVEPGDRGEVWIRTGSVFTGYLGDAPATAEVLVSDGWLATGDVAIADDDGTLYLVGRSKDLINVSGFNVFPAEVEDVLEVHPDVEGAVVVGEPHDATGERVVAYITSGREGQAHIDDVMDHCRQYLARYKVPRAIHVVDRLPLTAIGKRVRKELR